jgi:putative nucleotidyltransferase with HDIG domain
LAGATSQWTPAVISAVAVSALITLGSLYYSGIYQPKKLERAYRKALYALAAAVETKDSGTIGHAERVAEYALAVADDLGIDRSERLRIEYSALLRDIGKVSIPASLLNKDSRLDPDEWEQLKSHAKLGADMVSSVPFLSFLSDVILHHHEHWDGSGYPDRLSGEEIPLASRILAVTTDYDAMTSERPYHDPLPISVALELLKSGRGALYDPAVVDAFLRVLDEQSVA